MRELVKGVQVVEGAVAAPVVEVEHERRAVGRHERHRAPANRDAAFGIAGREGERLGRLRHQVHQQRPIDAHAVPLDVGTRILPVPDRLVVPKVDADLLENPHRGVVDALETFFVEHLVVRQRKLERRQHRRRGPHPRAVPGSAAAAC